MAAFALSLAASCASDATATQTDPVLAKGQEVHNSRCASCHGIKGEGGTGKKLNNGVVTQQLPNIADHVRIVNKGIPGTPMPSWEGVLTPEEITAVVRYQREVLAKITD